MYRDRQNNPYANTRIKTIGRQRSIVVVSVNLSRVPLKL